MTGQLTTFARPDGTMQVAYNGIPLYYFAGDTKAGDTTGQGKNGKWFVASPTGAPRPARRPLVQQRRRSLLTASPAAHEQERPQHSRGPFLVAAILSSPAGVSQTG